MNGNAVEENRLFCRLLSECRRGEDIFNASDNYFKEKDIGLTVVGYALMEASLCLVFVVVS